MYYLCAAELHKSFMYHILPVSNNCLQGVCIRNRHELLIIVKCQQRLQLKKKIENSTVVCHIKDLVLVLTFYLHLSVHYNIRILRYDYTAPRCSYIPSIKPSSSSSSSSFLVTNSMSLKDVNSSHIFIIWFPYPQHPVSPYIHLLVLISSSLGSYTPK